MKKIITALLLAVCMMSLTACKSTISGHVAGKVLEGLMAKDSEKDKEDNDGKTKDVKDQEEQSKGDRTKERPGKTQTAGRQKKPDVSQIMQKRTAVWN